MRYAIIRPIAMVERRINQSSKILKQENPAVLPGETTPRQENATKRFPLLTPEQVVYVAKAFEDERASKESALNNLHHNSDFRKTITPPQKEQFLYAFGESETVKELFIYCNLALVWSVAARYKPNSLTFEDRVQNGIFGLIDAVEGFDWRKGYKFSTYAVQRIKKAIQRESHDTEDTIRVPGHVKTHLDAARNKVTDPTKHTVEELTTILDAGQGGDARNAAELLLTKRHITYSYNKLLNDSGMTLEMYLEEKPDKISPEEQSLSSVLAAEVLSVLSEDQRSVMFLYMHQYTVPEMCEILGMSKDEISNLKKTALYKIRNNPDFSEYGNR